MTKDSKGTVSGIFKSREDLSEVINFLEANGVSDEDISILMPDETKNNQFAIDSHTKASILALKGLSIGSLIGAIIGGLFLIGAVMFPKFGFVVIGPVVGMIIGITAGGILGAIIGALIGLRIPEYVAKFYEQAVNTEGNILVVVNVNNNLKPEIRKQFSKYGALHINT